MWTTIVLPCLLLGLAAWLVPGLVARALPQSLPGLVVNGVVSALVLMAVGAMLFAALYGSAAGAVWRAAPMHFIVLSAQAMLVWGPVLVLSLSRLPRRWPPESWEVPGARDAPAYRGARD